MFVIILLINFLFTGPVLVGIPVLAKDRLPEDAAAFGMLMAAFAIGNLVGALASGAIRLKPGNIGGIHGCHWRLRHRDGRARLDWLTWEGMAILCRAWVNERLHQRRVDHTAAEEHAASR